MRNGFKELILFLALTLAVTGHGTAFAWSSSDGSWDYYGSGRDHPYSAYIDRRNYIGPADYAYAPDYIDYINDVTLSAPPPAPVPAPVVQQDEFTVNVPNSRGGYTPVVIKRSGTGFTGPQGEFYPQFPKVSQLQVIYGK